jgi:predicted ATP-grasp superfamily ATP-dependent carboligase
MNMFYTGLGIARSLGQRDVPVIGLTSQRGIYGNFTRYATVRRCPDSREQPDELLKYLVGLAKEIGDRAVIFPTRDDDLILLERYRDVLKAHFSLVLPESEVLTACLDKWETYRCAQRAGVASPRSWLVTNAQDLSNAGREATFPLVVKPVSSYVWRRQGNWAVIGGRKAIAVYTQSELFSEYERIVHADPHVLLQEMVPGGDDQLFVAACYINKDSKVLASFTAQKLLQCPPTCGTGCIVQTVQRPDVAELAIRYLQALRYTGIAEVEVKWDQTTGEFKLIEVNPRPWDQHSLGLASGTDLMYMAYCEHAGLPVPVAHRIAGEHKWVAEDAFLLAAGHAVLAGDGGGLRSLFRLAAGKRVYGIWSWDDKRPFFAYMFSFLPRAALLGIRYIAKHFRPFSIVRGTKKQEGSGV